MSRRVATWYMVRCCRTSDVAITTSSLVDGSYTLTAKLGDLEGNLSAASAGYTVTVDTTAPAAPTISLVNDDAAPGTGAVANGDVSVLAAQVATYLERCFALGDRVCVTAHSHGALIIAKAMQDQAIGNNQIDLVMIAPAAPQDCLPWTPSVLSQKCVYRIWPSWRRFHQRFWSR